ncbi:MAG TPA: hypothetical protein VLH79_11690 [Chthonomonadales bacterium]|nr:hypothetical protein [Chthonomonadales bacterium]
MSAGSAAWGAVPATARKAASHAGPEHRSVPAAPLIFEVTPAATLEHTVTLGPMAPPPPP